DLRGVDLGIELGGIAACACIAAEQRATFAPATARDKLAVGLGNEVRAIRDQFSVDAERAAQRALDLFRGVVAGAELASGTRDQLDPFGLVVERCGPNREVTTRCHSL